MNRMNRALLMAALRNRLPVIATAVFAAVLLRLGFLFGERGTWAGSEFQSVSYAVCFYGLGPAMAALLGTDLAAPAREGWGFLLARPVSRGQLLAVRAVADALTLAMVLGVLLTVLGFHARPWAWGAAILLWVVTHGVSATAGSLGLSPIVSVALGAVWGAAGLSAGLAAVLGGFRLQGYTALETLANTAGHFIPGQEHTTGAWQDWLPLAGMALGGTLTMLWGWRSAIAGIRRSPCPLPWKPEALKAIALLGVFSVLMVGGSAIAARSIGATARHHLGRSVLGLLPGGHALTLEHSRMGVPTLRRYDPSGRLVWSDSLLERCEHFESRPQVAVLFCRDRQYVFSPGSSDPETSAIDRLPYHTAWFLLLSPDGQQLMYSSEQGELRLRPLRSGQPGQPVPDQQASWRSGAPWGSIRGEWGEDGVIRLLDPASAEIQLRSGKDGALIKKLELDPDAGPGTRYEVAYLGARHMLVRIRDAGASSGRTLLVRPDGSMKEVTALNDVALRQMGNWPDGSPILAHRLKGVGYQVWRYPLDAEPVLLGEIHSEDPVLWIWKGLEGPGILVLGSHHDSGLYIAPLVDGQPGEKSLLENGGPGIFASSEMVASRPEGLLAFRPDESGAPHLFGWPGTPPFAQPPAPASTPTAP